MSHSRAIERVLLLMLHLWTVQIWRVMINQSLLVVDYLRGDVIDELLSPKDILFFIGQMAVVRRR